MKNKIAVLGIFFFTFTTLNYAFNKDEAKCCIPMQKVFLDASGESISFNDPVVYEQEDIISMANSLNIIKQQVDLMNENTQAEHRNSMILQTATAVAIWFFIIKDFCGNPQ